MRPIQVLAMVAMAIVIFPNASFADDAPTCKAEQTVTGSFFEGRAYKGVEEFPTLAQDMAFKKLYMQIAQEGWRISQADKDLGVISASEDVSESNGKQAPLNATVESVGTHGSKITIIFRTGSGQFAEDAPGYLCKLFSGLENR